jgi:branched-chain amino acid transport system permease protein
MNQIAVALVTGVSLGALFALIALGMVLAFRATHTFNFAHGQLMLIPAMLLGAGLRFTDSFILTLLVGLALSGLVAGTFYRFVLNRITGFMSTIATLGLALALDGAIQLMWGGQTFTLSIPGTPAGVTQILGVQVARADVVRTAFTAGLVIALAAFLRFTSAGLRVRLAGQDALLASQSGVNVRRIHQLSWAMAGVLAGVAGVVYGSSALVDPTMVAVALVAAPAMILGGLDSVPGAIVGGVIIGMFQSFVVTFLGSEFVEVASYALLLVVILVLPHGLFGTRSMVRV